MEIAETKKPEAENNEDGVLPDAEASFNGGLSDNSSSSGKFQPDCGKWIELTDNEGRSANSKMRPNDYPIQGSSPEADPCSRGCTQRSSRP